MTLVEYKPRDEFEKKKDQCNHDAIPAAKQALIIQRSASDRMIEVIIKTVFSYIYWLCACVYLLAYSEKLTEESKKGFRILCLSKCFWDFQRDVLLAVLGYLTILFILWVFLFRPRNE